MKKHTLGMISVMTALSMAACSAATDVPEATTASETPAATEESVESSSNAYKAGTYTGEAQGHGGTIKVTAEFTEDAISSVSLDLSVETESIGQAASETLIKEILDNQSADFDAVSGATETSDAVRRALKDIIDQAKGIERSDSKEKTALTDGTYTASATSFGFTGDMVGEVTVKDGKLSDIKITEETDSVTGQWFKTAEEKLIPRILEAQSLGIDSVSGATASSGAIKKIVAGAIDAAGGNSDEWYQAPAKSTETVKLEGYDVVVVGLGGSGILSYCAAAKAGAKVFGLEQAAALGGNSASVYGPMAINSKNLAEKYNDGKDYMDADDLYDTWIEYVETDKKADIIRKAIDDSGTTLDYYMDNFDFEFDGMNGLLGSFVRKDWDKEWTVYTADENNTKWYILGPDHSYQFIRAMEKAKAMNKDNDYMLELKGEELITDESGNITGVRCTYYDGTTYEVYGKNVILATGGFIGNDDMMKEYFGYTANVIGDTLAKGDGIRMGQSAGGATYAMRTLPMIHLSQVPNIIRTGDLTADQKAILSALAITTEAPEVTINGEKWGAEDASGTDESTGLTVGIAYAPGFMYYTAWSQEDIDNIRTNGLSETTANANVNFIGNGGTLPAAGTPVPDIDTILSVGEEFNDVLSGTPLELAEKMNVDPTTLAETLGTTKDSKDKFYLVACAGWSYGTVGSLDVDINMNVLREDGTPIENLYAVGQDSEGVCNADGKAYSPWGGQAQSWTFVSGRIAGENAAKSALG
ncbi:succinate dehydrogenase/fumarate reductase flavoprotein subunit [Lachnospiraceae bacterium JC7]|nr:succinate dehydrogenase/fumarate reductase flavoprotein subunit [Lachnospiraceae bacterium JC7]